jgi:hypothetical protein
MATPSELRSQTLRELRAARKDMASVIFQMSLRKEPMEVQRDAALKQLATQQAILTLENAELSEIRDQLVANETELAKGIAALGKARAKLTKVAKVLDALGSVLTTAAKIAKFATGLI